MLIELYCDKYQNDGQERGAISFHEGLNVVLGDRRAKNSIGKTTFLLAIDFALGGDQYANGSDGMLEEVGDHDVCFTFLFDGIETAFSATRPTKTLSDRALANTNVQSQSTSVTTGIGSERCTGCTTSGAASGRS